MKTSHPRGAARFLSLHVVASENLRRDLPFSFRYTKKEMQEARMPQQPYVIDQMISAKAIAARVEALATQITVHYAGCDKLVVVGLLRGSFVFIADLVREIDLPVEVDFLEASSYGDSMHSSREVRILKDLRGEIAGKNVLLVEDIVDTGFTLHHVINLLKSREPAMLEVCALLDKPSRREIDVRATWTGFEIPDEFVVGYGIDYAQRNRNLPYIGKVRFTD
jgi:hypoxanthine phosphoribosyltransferase